MGKEGLDLMSGLEWIADIYQLHTLVLLALRLHCSRKELERLGGEIRACECFCVPSSALASLTKARLKNVNAS